MKIMDTYPDFPENPITKNLRHYHQKYPNVFDTYFTYHCKNKDERLQRAIHHYAQDFSNIQRVYEKMPYFIKEVTQTFHEQYDVTFPINVNFIVGAYGFNAYTHRQLIPDITFALERLTPDDDPLKVIIAHEFGHAAHHILSDAAGMNWEIVQWEKPFIWLLQEGVATHFSKQIVPDIEPSVYFSYDWNGKEWLQFANQNKSAIIQCFVKDLKTSEATDIFKEWFSIRGGNHFGYTRLAYYIADCMFQDLQVEKGEMAAILSWTEDNFFQWAENWLQPFI